MERRDGGRNPTVDGPIGHFPDGADLDHRRAHHARQKNAKHAKAENRSTPDIQPQKCRDEIISERPPQAGCSKNSSIPFINYQNCLNFRPTLMAN
jgi:hypothetical protein